MEHRRLSACVWTALCEWLDPEDRHRLRCVCRFLGKIVRLSRVRCKLPLNQRSALCLSGALSMQRTRRPSPSHAWMHRFPQRLCDVTDMTVTVWPFGTPDAAAELHWPPNLKRLTVLRCPAPRGRWTRFAIPAVTDDAVMSWSGRLAPVPDYLRELCVSGCTTVWLSYLLKDPERLQRLRRLVLKGSASVGSDVGRGIRMKHAHVRMCACFMNSPWETLCSLVQPFPRFTTPCTEGAPRASDTWKH